MSGLGFAAAAIPALGKAKALLARWWKLGVGLILGALLCYPLAHCAGESAGRTAEKRWQAEQAARLARELADRARAADANRTRSVTQADADIRRNREELDRETANLPDESPSARRRARICRELREDARRRSAPIPAC